MQKLIMNLINEFSENHNLAKSCGSEYIYQSDEAQIDALKLVAAIFDLYAEKYEEECEFNEDEEDEIYEIEEDYE